jgi:acyl carrier protein
MNENIQKRIIEIVAQQAEIDPAMITPELTLDDLEVPSLTQLEILFAIEEAFDIDLPNRPEDPTLTGLSQLVDRYLVEKGANA